MEAGDSILDVIDEELSFEDGDDVEMMDVEEGEVVDGLVSGQISDGNVNEADTNPLAGGSQCTKTMNKTKKKKKKKNKNRKNKGSGGSNGVNIDRFVHGVCRHLKEKKSYLVYTAVGVLGVSALSDLVKEVQSCMDFGLRPASPVICCVDAVQACGGQKTADGNRFRSGGGVLWNILKVRDPNAYKEIMKKGKEFEKQFRRPSAGQSSSAMVNNSCQDAPEIISGKTSACNSDNDSDRKMMSMQEQPAQPSSTGGAENRRPVQDRVRMPVSYDDLLVEQPPKEQSASA